MGSVIVTWLFKDSMMFWNVHVLRSQYSSVASLKLVMMEEFIPQNLANAH